MRQRNYWQILFSIGMLVGVGCVLLAQENPGKPRPIRPPKDPKIELVQLSAGTFIMGSPFAESGRTPTEGPEHEVTLSAFKIGKYEVTQAEWRAVMGTNPAQNAGCDRCPVENVSWPDTQEFFRKLNALGGPLTYRLPTEAEWEYACRSGGMTPFSFGSKLSSDQANVDGTKPYGGAAKGIARGKTTTVGSFSANAFGLYDMHGNVQEWCQDWLGPYKAAPVTNPKGPATGTSRMIRGGTFANEAANARSAARNSNSPNSRYYLNGFRVVAVKKN